MTIVKGKKKKDKNKDKNKDNKDSKIKVKKIIIGGYAFPKEMLNNNQIDSNIYKNHVESLKTFPEKFTQLYNTYNALPREIQINVDLNEDNTYDNIISRNTDKYNMFLKILYETMKLLDENYQNTSGNILENLQALLAKFKSDTLSTLSTTSDKYFLTQIKSLQSKNIEIYNKYKDIISRDINPESNNPPNISYYMQIIVLLKAYNRNTQNITENITIYKTLPEDSIKKDIDTSIVESIQSLHDIVYSLLQYIYFYYNRMVAFSKLLHLLDKDKIYITK
jgi:hypothetical protein